MNVYDVRKYVQNCWTAASFSKLIWIARCIKRLKKFREAILAILCSEHELKKQRNADAVLPIVVTIQLWLQKEQENCLLQYYI